MLFIFVLPINSFSASKNLWISASEIAELPMSGDAWNDLLIDANKSVSPNISNQDDTSDSYTFAKALVYLRTGTVSYRNQVVQAIEDCMETENGGRTLALGRNLLGYVLAADLIDLESVNPSLDAQFRNWLSGVRHETMSDNRTLIEITYNISDII